ncbi:MAG TPA: hypothetical protein VND68_07925 [Chloroflexia bacterium]|nr:hypothetical protein [Chloroflexia bacterium]
MEIRVVTREDARWLAEKPFRERWCALNAVLQQIEDFLENEDDEETLSQHSQQFRLANTNSPADTSWEWLPWQYATNFIPRTLGAEYRGQPPTPNELMTPEVMEICKRVRFELGHYTRTRIVEGQRVTPQEWVDARMLVHALRELMDQLREMKPEFWLLEDGSQL